MKKNYSLRALYLVLFLAMLQACLQNKSKAEQSVTVKRNTIVSIEGEKFFINGKPTYEGRLYEGYPVEGLLMNSRMVQGIFDDKNSETSKLWSYPDSGNWSADRNTIEFVNAMESWYKHGMLAFTLNLQGGSPTGYGNKGWINSAFGPTGELYISYMDRLEKILDKADELGMVVILGFFYFGQDEYLENENAVVNAVDNAMHWLFEKGYRNILIEINNECNIEYDHEILNPERVHELLVRVRSMNRFDYYFPVATSFSGSVIPTNAVIEASDYVLLHGNGVNDPEYISEMVRLTKEMPAYRPMPILFNEDDHYNFENPVNNCIAAVKSYASWGYFDYRRNNESFSEGFQSIPVDWTINSERKKSFFNLVSKITGKE